MKWITSLTMSALLACLVVGMSVRSQAAPFKGQTTVLVLTKSGQTLEGTLLAGDFTFKIGETTQKINAGDLRSYHSADPAIPSESDTITKNLALIATVKDVNRKEIETACAELVDIGVPVISPLLKAFNDADTDAHEPNPLYRLFGRIIPGSADDKDRTLDLIRPTKGDYLRGKLVPTQFKIKLANGKVEVIDSSAVRRIGVRQAVVDRTFELQALHHCTYIAWLDTGISVTPQSKLVQYARGYVRLSFDEDGWAADPDGIVDPLPGKRRMQEGFRWGVVLGKVGSQGQRWLAGKHIEKSDLGSGRLYSVVNDNEHWQNNIGSFRVRLKVTDAYDLGDAQ